MKKVQKRWRRTLGAVAVIAAMLPACSHSSDVEDNVGTNPVDADTVLSLGSEAADTRALIANEQTDNVVSSIIVDGEIPSVAQGWNNMGKIDVSAANQSPFNNGVFEGWGTAFCWWANRVGYSDKLAARTARLFYTLQGKGLGLNIIRYNIGGGDDPTHHHITRTDSAVPGYLSADGTYDWTADANQRNCLLSACAVGQNVIVEGFSNSPPYFMTVSGCTGGSTGNGSTDNLKSDQFDAFATYLATVTRHYRSTYGITFQSVSPMNEPDTNYWKANNEKQEGCHWSPGTTQSTMIVALRNALDKQNLRNTIVCGSDETSLKTAKNSYNALSTEAKAALGRIDTHCYSDNTQGNKEALVETAKAAGKNLWQSEVDGNYTAGTNAGEMSAALGLAAQIIDDLRFLRPAAWCIWDIIDSHISTAGYNGNTDGGAPNTNGGYWGIATADHDFLEILPWKKYYGFGQFTRYIRPGYVVVPMTETSSHIAAYSAEEKKLVIVGIQREATDKYAKIDLSNFTTMPTSVRVIRTSGALEGGENLAPVEMDITLKDKCVYPVMKANSITTFIFEGIEA